MWLFASAESFVASWLHAAVLNLMGSFLPDLVRFGEILNETCRIKWFWWNAAVLSLNLLFFPPWWMGSEHMGCGKKSSNTRCFTVSGYDKWCNFGNFFIYFFFIFCRKHVFQICRRVLDFWLMRHLQWWNKYTDHLLKPAFIYFLWASQQTVKTTRSYSLHKTDMGNVWASSHGASLSLIWSLDDSSIHFPFSCVCVFWPAPTPGGNIWLLGC